MHPALSVIIFTIASGAGYGLLALLAVFAALDLLPEDSAMGLCATALALTLITGGLLHGASRAPGTRLARRLAMAHVLAVS
jgi:DMSO reductase anchor subunit